MEGYGGEQLGGVVWVEKLEGGILVGSLNED